GYAVKMAESAELVWGQAPPQGLAQLPDLFTVTRAPQQYLLPPITGSDMSLLVVGEEHIDGEIGVFTESGLLVGAGVMERGRCGIAVRGDDPTTTVQDGAEEGQPLYLEFRPRWGGERPLSVSPLVYRSDDIAVVEVDIASLPDSFVIFTAYPNPFNATTTFFLNIPYRGLAKVEIYDLSGRLVDRVWERREVQGSFRFNWNAGYRPAGYYFARLEHPTGTVILKLLLVK
ncbi:MAG: T9SS type A sorting domain-containing protein, partial [bacterium]